MCLLGKRYPMTSDEFHSARLPGQFDADMAGKRMRLKVPETWETQVSMKVRLQDRVCECGCEFGCWCGRKV